MLNKEAFSGILFDFEWKDPKTAVPDDFEAFIKLLLKRAVLVVSAQFKKVPIRFLHGGTAEFYIHLPNVSEQETRTLAESLRDNLEDFLNTRPEYMELGLHICHNSAYPSKNLKSEAFMLALRNGLLYAKAEKIVLSNGALELKRSA